MNIQINEIEQVLKQGGEIYIKMSTKESGFPKNERKTKRKYLTNVDVFNIVWENISDLYKCSIYINLVD